MLKKWINIFILLMIVISSGSVLSVLNSTSIYILFLFLFLFLLIANQKIFFSGIRLEKLIYAISIFIIITLPSQIYNGLSVEYYFLIGRLFFIGFFVVLCVGSIEGSLYKVLKIVIYFSFFSFLYANLTDFGFSLYTKGSYNVESILFLINRHSTIDFLGHQFYRSQGIFWEPSVLQLYISIFLLQSIQRGKKVNVIISMLSMFFTFSVTGFLISVAVLFFNFRKINISKSLVVLISIISSIFFVYLLYMKLYVTGNVSSSARELDFISGYRIIINNPIFGIGFDPDKYLKYMYLYMSNLIFLSETRGNTNSILYYILSFGIPSAIVYFYFLIKQKLFLYSRNIFVLVLIISALSSPLLLMNVYLLVWLSYFIGNDK